MNNFLSRETSHAPLRRDMPNPYGITLNSSSFTMGRCGACRVGHRAPLGRHFSCAEPLTRICFPHIEIPTGLSLLS